MTPKQDKHDPGDVINCEAFGNPLPSYRWINEDDRDSPVWGPKLEVQSTHIRFQKWTCYAYNYPQGVEHNISQTITFEVGK